MREDALSFRHQIQAIFQDPTDVFNPFYRVDHVFDILLRRFHLAQSTAEARELIATPSAAAGVSLAPYEEEILGDPAGPQQALIRRTHDGNVHA